MHTRNRKCVGAGLISLDILFREDESRPVSFYVGGTCGNVMMILSHMGWDSYPVARLDSTHYTKKLLKDMRLHGVHPDFITTDDGTTPVILQRNFINKDGTPTHKFESINGDGRLYLSFSSLTCKQATLLLERMTFIPEIFFFDRVSPAFCEMAAEFKRRGSLIFFEPSCKATGKKFEECFALSDIVKFSDQRIKDTEMFDDIENKIIIQTLGKNGLRFRKNSDWISIPTITNSHVVDTSGAGDWTTAAFINCIFVHERDVMKATKEELIVCLTKAQTYGSISCSYEGARGMMTLDNDEIQFRMSQLLI
jgi:sugar/nucleoside kinase (ribokinase family)